MNLIKLFILSFILTISLNAKGEVFFLPKESEEAKDKIIKLIKNANKKIDISMYNFSYKKFVKALNKARKNDIKINLYLDEKKYKKEKKLFKEFKNLKTFKIKNHIKLMLVDDKIAVFGSSNWTKDSFSENLELIYITKEKSDIKKIKKIFLSLEKDY